MNKKTIIILSTVLILFLVAGGVFWLISEKSSTKKELGVTPSFPSGEATGPGNGGSSGGIFPSGQKETALIELSDSPVSGAAFFKGVATSTVRYAEKSTGHIYEITPNGKNRQRLSNTTILKVFNLSWSPNADKLVMRYFDSDEGSFGAVKTFSATLNPLTNSLEGVFLPRATLAVATSPSEDKIFYLIDSGKTASGIISDFKNKNKRAVFPLPYSDFNVSWPSKGIISLLSKPSAFAGGVLYFLNPRIEKLEKIIGGVKGLTALISPNGKKVIYSQTDRKGLKTKILNVSDRATADFYARTFPEKCAWSGKDEDIIYCAVPFSLPSADYPDDWYKGKVSFNDSIAKIDIATGETKVLLSGPGFDIIKPFLSPDNKYFIFVNKKDNTLWSLKIE